MKKAYILIYVGSVICSLGDSLPEFKACTVQCSNYRCSNKRALGFNTKYTEADFALDSVSFPFRELFGWDCYSDCDYKCQQIITRIRESHEDPMVKFHGKWPFKRLFGVTEIASVIFSVMNGWISYHNLKKIVKQSRRSSGAVKVMYSQYMALLAVSIMGWIFSTIFHIRDLPITESMDYFGASLIIMANFYVISVRYFELFAKNLVMYQLGFFGLYLIHMVKLYTNWDYNYNIAIHALIGVCSFVLWALHALRVNSKYRTNYSILSNSMQLLPFETKILIKLNYLGVSRTRYIPIIPIFLNGWLFMSMFLEIFEFTPILTLVDSHAVWHLMTVFPQIIWFDWNIWDMEVYKKMNEMKQP